MSATSVVAVGHTVEVADPVAFYRHGWHSWSPSGWVDPTARRHPIADLGRRLGHDDPVHAFDEAMGGSALGAVEQADGSVTLLGALGPGGWVRPEGTLLRGESEAGAVEWYVATGDEQEVFAGYAEALAQRLGRRGGTTTRLWCSWYSYYEDITEAEMKAVITELGDLPFDVVQIDDGWEEGIGDWRPNADFPGGMRPLADRIRATGRRPGIWLAPLIAHSTSELAEHRPELLLRGDDGDPLVVGINWGGPYFALDPSSDATKEFLRELVGTVRGWGYDYLKLDFLYGAAFPGVHDHEMPREAAYREAIQVMREAAGDDCYLLACGAPIVASLGVFDGIRIGPDVAEFWEDPAMVALGDESARGARNALATSSQRLWLRPVIDTDPDVAFFRSEGIDLEPPTLQALRDLARIAGFLGVSDPPVSLAPSQRDALDEWLRSSTAASQVDRYAWQLEGREVDLAWVGAGAPSPAGPRGGG